MKRNCSRCKSETKRSICLDCMKVYNKKARLKARNDALEAYGGKSPKCACCGEKEIKFLALDHIANNGAEERREVGTGSYTLYSNLRKRKYPKGYQVLCHNCNGAKQYYGKCPHSSHSSPKKAVRD